MTTWLNTPIQMHFQMHFRVIDGLSVRFTASMQRGDHALLLRAPRAKAEHPGTRMA